ncbi:hypothetical protein ACFV98_15965 [Streptomyces violascens]|uniref:hypothetical protein n=1 Tax=Streptomyces violascens TaxID=67381 RepID=UPI00364D03FB
MIAVFYLFPLWLLGLIGTICAVCASFLAGRKKRAGCLLISLSLMVVVLYPAVMVWASLP